ncbi:MAG: sigma-54 dependent transcriptional regulator [Candidatus Sulfotelmatobacter sp.]
MSTSNPVSALIQPLGEMPPDSVVFGGTEAMRALRERLAKIAGANVPVLIQGESGTGKDIIARMIHAGSPWKTGPWVKVNCPAIPGTLLESELFGYEKGAFTGALKSKQGLFQAADGGTIFLDEIGELPLELQAKLLRVLQEKEVRPVGSNQRIKVDVRVIAATNRDLEAAYKVGAFRKDLYFRLNVVTLHVPALRERRSDTPMLVHWFLERYAPGSELRVSNAAMKALMQYDWPGNVRELENCVERAVALGNGHIIDSGDLPPAIAAATAAQPGSQGSADSSDLDSGSLVAVPESPQTPLSTTDLEDIERATIQRVFEQVNGDKALAGRMLGISRATLYRKLKRYNITGSGPDSSSHTLQ